MRTDLAPVREALLEQARQSAEARVDAASVRAGQIVAAAEQQADALLAAARADEVAQVERVAAHQTVAAHRDGRALVLSAQRRLYDRLRERCRAAAESLRAEPIYPELQRRLAAHAREVLGDRAIVREGPYGGVTAELGSRRLDLSLPVLAEHALDELEEMVRQLWT